MNFFHHVHHLHFKVQKVNFILAFGCLVPVTGFRTHRCEAFGVLHNRYELGIVAPDMPIERTTLSCGITVVTGEDVRDNPQSCPFGHSDNTFNQAFVGGIVSVAKERDLHVLAAGLACREVQNAITVGILESRCFKLRSGGFEAKRIIDGGVLIEVGHAGLDATRIDGGKRTLDQRFTKALAIQHRCHALAEVNVSI